MRLIKAGQRPEQQFAMVPNETIRDKRLSFRARGVLAYVLSHTDGYHVTADTVAEEGTEGRDAVRSAWRELESFGYLRRITVQGDDGRFSTIVEVFAYPQPTPDSQASVAQSSVDPASIEDQREHQREDLVVGISPSATQERAADTVSEQPPDWVKKIDWMSPEKWTMVLTFAKHTDPVAAVGGYCAWSEEHSVEQSFSRYWQWLAKAEAAGKSAQQDEDVNVRAMRAIRQQQGVGA